MTIYKHNQKAFWNGISKDNCRKVTGLANKVGTAVGAQEICVMWKNQFSNLYNSVDDGDKSKHEFNSKVNACINNRQNNITITDVSEAVGHQKKIRVQALMVYTYMLVIN